MLTEEDQAAMTIFLIEFFLSSPHPGGAAHAAKLPRSITGVTIGAGLARGFGRLSKP